MTTQLYDIPLNWYHIFDYFGEECFEENAKDKLVRKEVFKNFMRELPCRISELRKIVPAEIELDYSYASLVELDRWISGNIDYYVANFYPKGLYSSMFIEYKLENKLELLGDVHVRKAFSPLLRSLLTDASIYLAECIRRRGVFDLIWVEGTYNNKCRGSGHPRIYSEIFIGSYILDIDKEGRFALPYSLIRIENALIDFPPSNYADINMLPNLFRAAFGFDSDKIPPEKYLYSYI